MMEEIIVNKKMKKLIHTMLKFYSKFESMAELIGRHFNRNVKIFDIIEKLHEYLLLLKFIQCLLRILLRQL